MDLRNAVIAGIDRLIASGEIDTAIDKQLKSTISHILQDALSSYSDFGSLLKEAVKKAVACNGEIDLPAYNDLVIKVIRRQVEHQLNDSLQRQVAERVTKLLETPPESIKVSELVKSFIEDRLHHGCHCDAPEITCRVIESDTYGYWSLILDEEPDKSEYQADIRVHMTRDNEVYALNLGRVDVEKRLFVGPVYGFEQRLFQLYAAKSKLINDTAEFDVRDLVYEVARQRD